MKNTPMPPKSEIDAGRDLPGEQTFEEIYERYRRFVYLIAYDILGDRETAEDIMQEVFIKLLSVRCLSKIENMEAYLRTLTKRECVDAFRESNSVRRRKPEDEMPETSAELPVEESDIESTVANIINKKQVEYLKVFGDVFLRGKKQEEVAKERGISIETVRSHLKRAKEFFRRNLRK